MKPLLKIEEVPRLPARRFALLGLGRRSCALAGVVGVAVPLAAPELTVSSVIASAALWSAGFTLYATRYWPVLSRPRMDGWLG